MRNLIQSAIIRNWFFPIIIVAASAIISHSAMATSTYENAFGPGPDTEIPCRAVATFFPGIGTSKSEKKLSVLPMFSITPDETIREATRVVIQGYPTKVRFFEPTNLFPPGAELADLSINDGVARVQVSSLMGEEPHPLAAQALAHTLAQFEEVDSVILELLGDVTVGPLSPDSSVLEDPPPPRLLDVVSALHEGEEPIEITVLFDRPIDLDRFSIRRKGQGEIRGKTYISMFDMAVVFRPTPPTKRALI